MKTKNSRASWGCTYLIPKRDKPLEVSEVQHSGLASRDAARQVLSLLAGPYPAFIVHPDGKRELYIVIDYEPMA